MASITFDTVSKVFPDGTVAVDALDLHIPDGGFTVLVGPSGSGKSTALRMVAGLEDVTSGTILIGDRDVTAVPPKGRDIAMVFQSYALYPHMSVADNMGFALRMAGEAKASRMQRVRSTAGMLGIRELLERRPRALSGGQRQRVALGRAIVREPQAFLMDEPLSNLDAKLRVEMRAYIAGLHAELGTTILYVTHDQVEAMTMGDRVAVMRDGRLEQAAAPQVLYDTPANLFVAGFIGSPAMNLMCGRLVEAAGGGATVELGSHHLPLPPSLLQARPGLRGHVGQELIFGVRPESLEPAVAGDDAALDLPVVLTEALGSDLLVHLEIDAPGVRPPDIEEALAGMASGVEGAVTATATAQRATTAITARMPPRLRIAAGDRLRVRVDMAAAHYFDHASERALR